MVNSSVQFSIIIPIYNAEKYLVRCIQSILDQTYQNFELILVNDGSQDNSLSISERYAKKDDRIKVVSQKNQGVSSARNRGIELAKAEYVTFIDSDDFIASDYLKIFSSDAEIHNADIMISGTIIKYEKSLKKKDIIIRHIDSTKSSEIPDVDKKFLLNPSWGKCYRRELIINHCIEFDETFHFGEDVIFNFTYLQYVSNLSILNYAGYYYFQSKSDSLVKRQYSYEKTKEFATKITTLRYQLMNRLKFNNNYICIIEKQNTLYTIASIMSMYSKKFKKNRIQRLKILKENTNILELQLLPKGLYYSFLAFTFRLRNVYLIDQLLYIYKYVIK